MRKFHLKSYIRFCTVYTHSSSWLAETLLLLSIKVRLEKIIGLISVYINFLNNAFLSNEENELLD